MRDPSRSVFLWILRNSSEQLLYKEAVTEGVLQKKVFLKISQNSQENTCARVSFLINCTLRPVRMLLKLLGHSDFPSATKVNVHKITPLLYIFSDGTIYSYYTSML